MNDRKAAEYGSSIEHYEIGSYMRVADYSALIRGVGASSEMSCVPLRSVATEGGLRWIKLQIFTKFGQNRFIGMKVQV